MLRLANLVTTFILIFQTSSEPFIGFSSPTDQRVSIQNGDPLARSIFAVVYLIFKNLYQLLENGRFHEEIHVFQFFKAKIWRCGYIGFSFPHGNTWHFHLALRSGSFFGSLEASDCYLLALSLSLMDDLGGLHTWIESGFPRSHSCNGLLAQLSPTMVPIHRAKSISNPFRRCLQTPIPLN